MSRLLEQLQGRILARASRLDGGDVLDREFGAVLGRCRSWVGHARAGRRKMDVADLAALVRRFGAVAVLEPLARLDGCTVVEVEAAPAPDCQGQSLTTAQVAVAYTQTLRDACADGTIGAAEREALTALTEQLVRSAHSAVPELGRLR